VRPKSWSPLDVFLSCDADGSAYDREECARLTGGARREDLSRYYTFRCARTDGGVYCVYKYTTVMSEKLVKHPILSVMRGTVVRLDGNVPYTVAFPFAKFFNYAETRYTSQLPSGARPRITLKLDGTLIIVWRDPFTGELHYNTRGMTEWHSPDRPGPCRTTCNPYVIAFLNSIKRLSLEYELDSLAREDRTVMFELVSDRRPTETMPEPDSDKWTPYLIAYRRHDDYRIMYPVVDFDPGALPHVPVLDVRLDELLETVPYWTDKEGVVIHYPGLTYDNFKWWNYLVKLKSIVYVLESSPGGISYRTIARLIIDGYYDDLKPYLRGDRAVFAEQYNRIIETIKQELAKHYPGADSQKKLQEYKELLLRAKRRKTLLNQAHALAEKLARTREPVHA